MVWGSVRETSFKLRRNIEPGYYNSFLPRIRGRISLTGGGSRLQVTMFVHPLLAVLMAVWLLMAGSWALSPIGQGPEILIAWGMVAFGLVVPPVFFFPEAIKARRLLEELATAGTCVPVQ